MALCYGSVDASSSRWVAKYTPTKRASMKDLGTPICPICKKNRGRQMLVKDRQHHQQHCIPLLKAKTEEENKGKRTKKRIPYKDKFIAYIKDT